MKNLNRRSFLKAAAAGAAVIAGTPAVMAADKQLSEDRIGILVDTDVCVGCRHCEWACRSAHSLDAGELDSYLEKSIFDSYRRPDAKSLTVVNRFENKSNPLLPVFVKQQCMHCEKPACVSACIVGALTKREDGSVTWDGDKCIGCRYCMVACQFQIPVYDWDRSIDPQIRKCDLCYERRSGGKLPACVEICPNEALLFGKRTEVLTAAKKRIKRKPEVYVDYIYGETEIGGTTWMYISSKKFSDLNFPALGSSTAPGTSEAIQHGIFAYFVPPVTLFALLGMVMWMTNRKKSGDVTDAKSDIKEKET